VSIVDYRETVWSDVFPGNQHTVHCLEPAVLEAESALELSTQHRKRTVWRLDGGAGSDQHIRWLMGRGYHVVAKGMSHSRAKALAKRITRWDSYQGVELGEVEPPVDYGRPARVFVKRVPKNDDFIHSYYVVTISLASKGLFMASYDQRGAAEVEQFRGDKSGLGLEARRKRSFLGQKGYILLTDLAHNLLSDFYHRALRGSRFETYGPKRIIRDLLSTPGKLIFEQGSLVRVDLLTQKQYSQDLATCLKTFVSGGES
jgi:hypothetical protein